jgi:hypothetical protein
MDLSPNQAAELLALRLQRQVQQSIHKMGFRPPSSRKFSLEVNFLTHKQPYELHESVHMSFDN